MPEETTALISPVIVSKRIAEMADEIDAFYKDQYWYKNTNKSLIVIGVMTNGIFFMADLVRKLSIRTKMDFIRVLTYPDDVIVPQEAKIITLPKMPLYAEHVLIVDDILDTGRTLKKIKKHLHWPYPESIRTAVLLRKEKERIPEVTPDFVGFDVPDEFVVGMGLDYNGSYRNLPYISKLNGGKT